MSRAKTEHFPVIPIRNTVVFPGITMPLSIGRSRSVAALKAAKQTHGYLLLVCQRDDEDKDVTSKDLYRVGTLVKIDSARGNSDDGFQVLVSGEKIAQVTKFRNASSYILAHIEERNEEEEQDPSMSEALRGTLKELAQDILSLIPIDTRQIGQLIESIDDLNHLCFLVAEQLNVSIQEKQAILECSTQDARCLKVLEMMQRQKQTLIVQSDIRNKISRKMGQAQRETILREQMRAIQEELGDRNEEAVEDELEKRITEAKMPAETEQLAREELKRMRAMGPMSAETHLLRNYVETLCDLPWQEPESGNDTDLDKARVILEEDHYGLGKVKKRIVEHLAVMKLKKGPLGSVLLFVGPPGVGKTSLGQSIARALERKFARVSLGGTRDESDIRGHRRTYVGAMPGRIIQSIKKVGEKNPVILLDEIDKMGQSWQGDPSAALLEVLDPEQNDSFTDHYLNTPYDLSKVFFIATANTLDTIPEALRDRLEVIEISGYTTPEKMHIAKQKLWPKQLEKHGIMKSQLKLSDTALLHLITRYTREAGVRGLQREISALCRGSTEDIVRSRKRPALRGKSFNLSKQSVKKILGKERFQPETATARLPTGVSTGLAWTQAGGDILFIEARIMPGNGRLTLTGQLGDVMQESAQIALSLIRSYLPQWMPNFQFQRQDFHIHVPSGSIPKDGPSAGITMLTALASLLTGKAISAKTAMTGEVTLRGRVTPVGGIKEKILAAHRAGISRVIIPKDNAADLEDIPADIRGELDIMTASRIDEVLKTLFNLTPREARLHSGLGLSPDRSHGEANFSAISRTMST